MRNHEVVKGRGLPLAAFAMVLAAAGCAAAPPMKVASGSAAAGTGSFVTMRGGRQELEGTGVRVGDALRSAVLAKTDLSSYDIASGKGKVRIISVVPSVDTRVCERQTHQLGEQGGGLDPAIERITVSMDLPFAQKRFAEKAGITNVLFLSDYKTAEFGKSYGLLLKELHLLSRAVLVVDKDNVVRWIQVVPEVTELPDLEAAFRAAKGL